MRHAALRVAAIVSVAAVALASETVPSTLAGGVGWPDFRFGPEHSGFVLGSSVTASNVGTMTQRWRYGSGEQQGDPIVGDLGVVINVDHKLVDLSETSGHVDWSRSWNATTSDAAYTVPFCSRTSPPTCDGTFYAVQASGSKSQLVAMHENGGKNKWSFTYPSLSWPTTAYVAAPGRNPTPTVYVTSGDGTVFDFAPGSNIPVWRTRLPSRTCYAKCPTINSVTPTEYGGKVYVSRSNGRVYALGAIKGKLDWQANVGGTGTGSVSMAVSDGHLLVATSNNAIVSLDPATGKKQWIFTQNHLGIGTGMAAAYGLVYVTGIGNGPHGANPMLEALNINTGKIKWTFTTSGYSAMSPSVTNGVLFVADTSSDLYAVNAKTGTRLTTIAHMGNYGPTYPAIVGHWVYVANYAFRLPGVGPD